MTFLTLNQLSNRTLAFILVAVVCLGSLSSTEGESGQGLKDPVLIVYDFYYEPLNNTYIDYTWMGVNVNRPDLRLVKLDNRFDTVQLHGIWIFYENYDYNSDEPGAVQVIFEPIECSTKLSKDLAWKVSSIRHAGSTSYYYYNGSTLTLYRDSSFQGREQIVIEADNPHVSVGGNGNGTAALAGFGSIILAGNASWTLYSSPSFEGDAVCVHPQGQEHNDRPTFIYETDEILELARNSIQSVRIGCYGNTTATIPVIETHMSHYPPPCDSRSWPLPPIQLCECLAPRPGPR